MMPALLVKEAVFRLKPALRACRAGRLPVFVCICALLLCAAAETMAAPSAAVADDRGTVVMARATWDTGWFQAAVFQHLMTALGYRVQPPTTMENAAFYRAAARGEVHMWANGWFPTHNRYMSAPEIKQAISVVGFEVIAGALQGYLIDKKSAAEYGIDDLGDLKDAPIARHFDADGDGRADLIGCNAGWGCEALVEHHLDAYGLRETVAHVQGDYAPLMAQAVERYQSGRPILFYTWTPNWTVGTLVPGEDVIWLNVPFPSLPPPQAHLESQTSIPDVPGCVQNPCALGFPPNDIRVVANRAFLQRHPDLQRLFALVEIPLDDISAQNARMLDGEDDEDDIRRHAAQWIAAHRRQVDQWLSAARALQPAKASPTPGAASAPPSDKPPLLRVVTKRFEPFVLYRDRRYIGFSIDLWTEIARSLDMRYELYGVNTIAKLLDEVERGAADIAVSGIGITAKREKTLDFSYPFFESGLQIMVPETSASLLKTIVHKVFAILISSELIYGVGVFLAVLLIAAHLIWLLERRHNPQFPGPYVQGLWQSIWWAIVTVTTVGYGDKTPRGTAGRLFGVVWILAGYFVFAYFTASVTSTVTVQELHGTISGPEDLYGKRVATVKKSTAADYLTMHGITPVFFAEIDAAYHRLVSGDIDALVFDAPVLQHYAGKQGRGKVKVVGLVFQEQYYGFALQRGSPFREKINIALLKLIESGVYDRLHEKWFGS